MNTESQPTSQMQVEPKVQDARLSRLNLPLNELAPSFYALAVGAMYASGFLVLNSNLAKSGVLDVEFVDARYFLAGANFFFFLVCFYLFAGRAVLFTPKWLKEDLERINKDKPRPIWSIIILTHSLITGTFFCCLSAVLFTSLAIGNTESALFYAALACAFLVLYTLDVTNIDVSFPKFSEIVTIAAKIIAIYTFFAHIESGAMFKAFFSYVAIFLFINLMLDGFDRYKITTDRIIFSGIYAVVFLIGTAVGYGTLFYDQVSSKFGGARPQTVSIGISEEARTALPTPFAASASQVLEGKLIHQTPEYTYIASLGHTLRLRATDVVALVSTPEPERAQWKVHSQRAASATSPPTLSVNGTAASKSASSP